MELFECRYIHEIKAKRTVFSRNFTGTNIDTSRQSTPLYMAKILILYNPIFMTKITISTEIIIISFKLIMRSWSFI